LADLKEIQQLIEIADIRAKPAPKLRKGQTKPLSADEDFLSDNESTKNFDCK
jgi:hypothetical protein